MIFEKLSFFIAHPLVGHSSGYKYLSRNNDFFLAVLIIIFSIANNYFSSAYNYLKIALIFFMVEDNVLSYQTLYNEEGLNGPITFPY